MTWNALIYFKAWCYVKKIFSTLTQKYISECKQRSFRKLRLLLWKIIFQTIWKFLFVNFNLYFIHVQKHNILWLCVSWICKTTITFLFVSMRQMLQLNFSLFVPWLGPNKFVIHTNIGILYTFSLKVSIFSVVPFFAT